MRELCGLIYPALSEAMEEGAVREGSASEWREFSEADYSVYLRWHTELPDAAVALFASGDGSGTGKGAGDGYQAEVFLLPYARGGNTATAALREAGGDVRVLTVTMPGTILAREDLPMADRFCVVRLVNRNGRLLIHADETLSRAIEGESGEIGSALEKLSE